MNECVTLLQLGGTTGDIEGRPFIEAFRQFQFRVGRENFMNVHVSLIVETGPAGEHKTKPTQNSVATLRGEGIWPDLVRLSLFFTASRHLATLADRVPQQGADRRQRQEQTTHLLRLCGCAFFGRFSDGHNL